MSIIYEKVDFSDIERLIELWQDGFGDDLETIAAFFDNHQFFDTGLVAKENGKVLGVMYRLNLGEADGKNICYLYALTADKELRGQGIGKEIVTRLRDLSFEEGFDIVCLKPANDKLREWYTTKCGFLNQAENKKSIKSAEMDFDTFIAEVDGKDYTLMRLNADEYFEIRKQLIMISKGAMDGISKEDRIIAEGTRRYFATQEAYNEPPEGGLFGIVSGGQLEGIVAGRKDYLAEVFMLKADGIYTLPEVRVVYNTKNGEELVSGEWSSFEIGLPLE